MVNQMTVTWTGLGSDPHKTVLHFSGGTVGGAETVVDAFLDGLMPYLYTGATAQIDSEYRLIDTATGVLTAVGSFGTTTSHAGEADFQPVADATQLLVRWQTEGIVAGKRVKGRTFVPYLASPNVFNGNVADIAIPSLTAAAQTIVNAANMVIWARPLKDPTTGSVLRPGTTWDITGTTIWPELAVLRRRRG